jgi:hypothetical protein
MYGIMRIYTDGIYPRLVCDGKRKHVQVFRTYLAAMRQALEYQELEDRNYRNENDSELCLNYVPVPIPATAER